MVARALMSMRDRLFAFGRRSMPKERKWCGLTSLMHDTRHFGAVLDGNNVSLRKGDLRNDPIGVGRYGGTDLNACCVIGVGIQMWRLAGRRSWLDMGALRFGCRWDYVNSRGNVESNVKPGRTPLRSVMPSFCVKTSANSCR